MQPHWREITSRHNWSVARLSASPHFRLGAEFMGGKGWVEEGKGGGKGGENVDEDGAVARAPGVEEKEEEEEEEEVVGEEGEEEKRGEEEARKERERKASP